MHKVKVLHLATDEKFIDQAIRSFKTVASTENTLCLVSDAPPRFVKSSAFVISRLKAAYCSFQPQNEHYDILVIHSLHPDLLRPIQRLNHIKVKIWLGWGYDYYDIINQNTNDLLLPRTSALHTKEQRRRPLLARLKGSVKRTILPNKCSLIESIDLFAPVLPLEHDLVSRSKSFVSFPKLATWNYGNLEDDLIRGFENARVHGSNILLGNSATAENNHLDSFELLRNANLDGSHIVAPLSYGDANYREKILVEGKSIFGDSFLPLTSFLSIDDYVKTICSCNKVIMNHVRQQAVGNIVIMLYLGAKVFLREECPTFAFLKSLGAVIFSIQDIERDNRILHDPLTTEQQYTNKTAVTGRWSKQAAETRTSRLISQALKIANGC